jgi:phosphate starvation-inducible PhoH-like protein
LSFSETVTDDGGSLDLVIQDHKILRDLCGIGDANLKVIEQITGSSLFSKGNIIEISDTVSPSVREFTRNLLHSSIALIQSGLELDSYQIHLLAEQLHDTSEEDPKKVLDQVREQLNDRYVFEISGKSIAPKSRHQRRYMQAMLKEQIVFGIGPAGTGKTFLAIAKALEELQNGRVHKIVLTRPVVEAGESLGFLPGDLSQKIAPYLRPLYDAMEALTPLPVIRKMEENGVIEIAPLAYMRGRSLQNAFIILDEAQNTTKEQMKMFLTRLGFGAQAVITGDVTQIDLPKKQNSGLLHASGLLRSIEGISLVHFDSSDVVRSALVKRIVDAYEKE